MCDKNSVGGLNNTLRTTEEKLVNLNSVQQQHPTWRTDTDMGKYNEMCLSDHQDNIQVVENTCNLSLKKT